MFRTRRQILSFPVFALLAACAPAPTVVRTPTPTDAPPTATPAPSPLAATPTTAPATEPTSQPVPRPTPQPTAAPSVAAASADIPGSSRVKIRIDSVGYPPTGAKVVTVQAPQDVTLPDSAVLNVVSANGASVLSATLKGPRLEPEGGTDRAWLADVSGIQTPGPYQLRFARAEASPLIVSSDVYSAIFRDAVRSYYLNRCGLAIDDPVTGVHHGACHRASAVLEADRGTKVEVTGGWHDAGDYGRYMPTATVTTAQMLLLAELVPAARQPLTGTDLVSEIRYELDWMLKMQREDGGVYHKVSTENFPGFILPEDDTAPELVYGVGSRSTGLFAAATARAARFFQASDPAYADRLASAAKGAWKWLEQHPEHLVPPVGNTGAYLTGSDADARAWAAAELFALTGTASYEDYYKGRSISLAQPPTWDNVDDLAVLTYAFAPKGDSSLRRNSVAAILDLATSRAASAGEHPYGVGLEPSEYRWSSAKFALAIGEHLVLANLLRPNPRFREIAAAQLHWVLGRNPLGRSFVTGLGVNSPQHPHDRLVAAGGKMIPGMLVGGPNSGAEDGIAPPNLGPRSYVDEQGAYSCNEPAIDYTAPLVFLSGYLAQIS